MVKEKEKKIKNKKKDKKNLVYVVLASLVIIVVMFLFFRSNKVENKNNKPMAPIFKKQGELTISGKDNRKIVTIDIEIADTEEKREIGLMGRPAMGEKEGMLFIFEYEHIASFWMKNTIIPLDMIFIDKTGKIITIHKNTTPFSEQSYTASGMTLFVLEVNAGFTDKYGIKEGDIISWRKL